MAIVEAVETLVDILHRMECHQYKKRTLLRRLDVAGSSLPFVEDERVESAALR